MGVGGGGKVLLIVSAKVSQHEQSISPSSFYGKMPDY